MSQPLISFAIPTYNFGRFIGQTIRSIIEGAKTLSETDFEIAVLDGGSTDNTEEIMDALRGKYRNIKYQKNSARGGIDRDLDAVADMASGKYIFLFSADDLLVPGWDTKIQNALGSNPDVLLVPAMLCTLDMKPIRAHPIFDHAPEDSVIEFLMDGGASRITEYLRRAKSLEALFSFMSAIVVRTDVWKGTRSRPDYYGSCWAHCARMMPVLHRQSRIKYIAEMLILKRGENDSFMENGLVRRIEIAVAGWTRIINEFFFAEDCKKEVHAKLRLDISLPLFLYAKLSAKNDSERKILHALARQHFCLNSPTATSRFFYTVFLAFPTSDLIYAVVQRFLPQLKLLRHKTRSIFQ